MEGLSTFPNAPRLKFHQWMFCSHIQDSRWEVLSICMDEVGVLYGIELLLNILHLKFSIRWKIWHNYYIYKFQIFATKCEN